MLTKQIDYILELTRTLNFSRAAENLFISQPTLSYQIKVIEQELGFRIFDRSGRTVRLTPAGAQFTEALQTVRGELQRAVEQAQNFGARYSASISIGMAVRPMLIHLPEAIVRFAGTHPATDVVPYFQYAGMLEQFLRGERDLLFACHEDARRYPEARFHELFRSRIYLITRPDDPLAQQDVVREQDLDGRTLMVGGGSPAALRAVQQRIVRRGRVSYFNSPDHDNTLTNVAARKGVCLSPGFLNDRSGQFAWIPFDCDERFTCGVCTHAGEERRDVLDFVETLRVVYDEHADEPL